MPRAVEEWVGSTDDSAIPPRVRIRVFEKYGGICQCGCGMLIRASDPWQADHFIALINGGGNRETNLIPIIKSHHFKKTKQDVAEKSRIYAKKSKHLGIKKKSRFPGSRDSKWKKKIDGTVVRRDNS